MRALLFQNTGTRLFVVIFQLQLSATSLLTFDFCSERTRLYVVWHNLQGTNIELDAYLFVSAGGCGILEAFDDVG